MTKPNTLCAVFPACVSGSILPLMPVKLFITFHFAQKAKKHDWKKLTYFLQFPAHIDNLLLITVGMLAILFLSCIALANSNLVRLALQKSSTVGRKIVQIYLPLLTLSTWAGQNDKGYFSFSNTSLVLAGDYGAYTSCNAGPERQSAIPV